MSRTTETVKKIIATVTGRRQQHLADSVSVVVSRETAAASNAYQSAYLLSNSLGFGTGIDGAFAPTWSITNDAFAAPDVATLFGYLRVSDPVVDADVANKGYARSRIKTPVSSLSIGGGVSDITAAINGTALSTIAGVGGRSDLVPFVATRDLTISAAGIEVTTALLGWNSKILVYDADGTGKPTTLLGSVVVTGTGAVTVMAAATFTFEAGKLYWLGMVYNDTVTRRAIPVDGLPSLGIAGAVHNTVLRPSTGTYAAPANPITTYTLVSAAAPAIKLRPA